MASALIEELKTVATEAKRSQIEYEGVMGSPSGRRGPSREKDRNSTGRSRSRRRGRGEGGGVGAGVLDSENNGRTHWQPSLIGRLS